MKTAKLNNFQYIFDFYIFTLGNLFQRKSKLFFDVERNLVPRLI